MKKTLSVVLAVIMALSVFAVTAFAAGTPVNNVIEGVYEEYPATRTVTFTAIGEGMDNEEPAEGDVRYVPVSWETDEDRICGEFAEGEYSARYTNRLFGDHTLAVTFEKQVYIGGEWVSVNAEVPVVDVKEVSYYVGPNAEEEKEIIFPMQILKYIYALLSYLVETIMGFVG